MMRRALAVLAAGCWAAAPWASDARAQGGNLMLGTTIEATTQAPIRVSPPSGLFLHYGRAIGELEVGSEYRLIRTERIRTLFYDHTWALVEPVTPEGGQGTPGWVYLGSPDEITNFTLREIGE